LTTTTKIFVILVCLFAFIFTPLAIQFAAFTNDWRMLAIDYRDQLETSMAGQRSAHAVMMSQIAHHRKLSAEAYDQAAKKEEQIVGLEKRRNDLELQSAKLERDVDSLRTSTERLTAEMAIINTLNQDLLANKDRLTRSEQELSSRNLDLKDRVKELSTEVVVLKQQLYQAQETAAYQSKENEKLRKQLQLGPAAEMLTSTPTPQVQAQTPAGWTEIRGQVTAVRGNAATINVGSSSGVKPAMEMVVLRENEYICDLVVTADIAPNEAVATVKAAGGKQVHNGDTIVDLHSFMSR